MSTSPSRGGFRASRSAALAVPRPRLALPNSPAAAQMTLGHRSMPLRELQ
ncbi:hypothetical protein IVB18_47255 [Bradyrhizobium sp. 186]|nr:hypothetical protein [Bradyrhizobium sp. 186]UPK35465.1 hypothetical protein IVB18_47255 [Bradyrhizobium sp. 186]